MVDLYPVSTIYMAHIYPELVSYSPLPSREHLKSKDRYLWFMRSLLIDPPSPREPPCDDLSVSVDESSNLFKRFMQRPDMDLDLSRADEPTELIKNTCDVLWMFDGQDSNDTSSHASRSGFADKDDDGTSDAKCNFDDYSPTVSVLGSGSERGSPDSSGSWGPSGNRVAEDNHYGPNPWGWYTSRLPH